MPEKYTDEELLGLVKTPGWQIGVAGEDKKAEGTLEHLLRLAHARRKGGEAHGLIEQVETAIELDMIQIEKLWWHLGLPL